MVGDIFKFMKVFAQIVCAALMLFAVFVSGVFIIGVGFRLAMKLINLINV